MEPTQLTSRHDDDNTTTTTTTHARAAAAAATAVLARSLGRRRGYTKIAASRRVGRRHGHGDGRHHVDLWRTLFWHVLATHTRRKNVTDLCSWTRPNVSKPALSGVGCYVSHAAACATVRPARGIAATRQSSPWRRPHPRRRRRAEWRAARCRASRARRSCAARGSAIKRARAPQAGTGGEGVVARHTRSGGRLGAVNRGHRGTVESQRAATARRARASWSRRRGGAEGVAFAITARRRGEG